MLRRKGRCGATVIFRVQLWLARGWDGRLLGLWLRKAFL